MALPNSRTGDRTSASQGDVARDLAPNHADPLPAMLPPTAGSVRLWPLGWNIPDVFEEATPFIRAWRLWTWDASGLYADPRCFNYPALTAFRESFQVDASASLLLARQVNVACHVGT